MYLLDRHEAFLAVSTAYKYSCLFRVAYIDAVLKDRECIAYLPFSFFFFIQDAEIGNTTAVTCLLLLSMHVVSVATKNIVNALLLYIATICMTVVGCMS